MATEMFGIAFPGQGAKRDAIIAALRDHREHPIVGRFLAMYPATDPADLDFDDTAVAQPATYATSLAATEAALGATPSAVPLVLGHSLGELTALACAGVVDVESGFELAVRRGELCREQNRRRPGAMVAVVGTELDDVEWLRRCAVGDVGGILEIAAINSRRQTVLSGDLGAVRALTRLADQDFLRTEVLSIGGGFHSPLMLEAIPAWRDAVGSVRFQPARATVVSTVDARAHTEPGEFRDLLVRALLLPVRWRDAVGAVRDLGVRGLWDAGPGDALLKLGRRERTLPFAPLGSALVATATP